MLTNIFRIGAPLRATPCILRQRPFSTGTTARLLNPVIVSKAAPFTRFPPQTIRLALVRSVASQVSGRPGSQSLDHAATNIKEEVGNSTADLARSIAGGNVYGDAVQPTTKDTFVSRVQLYSAL